MKRASSRPRKDPAGGPRRRRLEVRRVGFLAAAFLLVGLATSRIALFGHELVGHGALAEVLAADVESWRLFLFGGGWVSYRWAAPPGNAVALAVSLGGIGFEVVMGGVALLLAARARTRPIARIALVSMAGVVLLHAGFYLAAGTHHGFGDGRMLHHLLGGARSVLVVPVALAVVAGGFWLGNRLARDLSGWTGGGALARAGSIVIAGTLAAGAHAALAFGERALRRDEVHATVMQHQSERDVRRDLAGYSRKVEIEQGREPSAGELSAMRAALARKHRRFPLREVLAVALGAACLAGLGRGAVAAACRAADPEPMRWRQLAPLALLCAVALLLVGLL
jgi:hypothetical protein